MRPRSILSFAALLLIAGFGLALGRSPQPSAQVVPLPAPTPPAAVPLSPGQIMQSQMHKRPPGIAGFLDPTTGRFAPLARSATDPSPSLPTTSDTPISFTFQMHWSFNSALKPWNTVTCTATVTAFAQGLSLVYLDADKVYAFSVGNAPPEFVVATQIVNLSGVEEISISCGAVDDSDESHYGHFEKNLFGAETTSSISMTLQ
jgi:hypothetical protein